MTRYQELSPVLNHTTVFVVGVVWFIFCFWDAVGPHFVCLFIMVLM